ncbi:hypothetical protein KJ934_01130 [Patescibacteria group bacterium]|nr:hypothetical protein [Patescibacteria group bacterium]
MDILNKSVFPEYFENFKEFENFIDEWLESEASEGRSFAVAFHGEKG